MDEATTSGSKTWKRKTLYLPPLAQQVVNMLSIPNAPHPKINANHSDHGLSIRITQIGSDHVSIPATVSKFLLPDFMLSSPLMSNSCRHVLKPKMSLVAFLYCTHRRNGISESKSPDMLKQLCFSQTSSSAFFSKTSCKMLQ